jgi:hypothetical protein
VGQFNCPPKFPHRIASLGRAASPSDLSISAPLATARTDSPSLHHASGRCKPIAKQHSRFATHLNQGSARGDLTCLKYGFHKWCYCLQLHLPRGARKTRHLPTTRRPHRLRRRNHQATRLRSRVPLLPPCRPHRLAPDNLLQRPRRPPQARRHLRRRIYHSKLQIRLSPQVQLSPRQSQRLQLRFPQAQRSASG